MSKILFLNRRYCPGEAWTNRILAYAKGFADAGEEVYLYYLISDKNRTPYSINIPGVNVVNLFESDGFLVRRFRYLSFLKNLRRFKKQIRLGDKFFVYGGYEYQLKVALSVKDKAKVFCEITEHPNIHGTSIQIERSNARKIKMLKKLDGLFVISRSLKEYYLSHGVPEEKIHIINMFVDTGRFDDLSKTTEEKYIAYCGAVSYGKDGCDTLLKAFSIFHKNHTDYNLYIIGKGVDKNVIPQLQKLAKQLSIGDAVKFTGRVAPDQVPNLLYNASMLALARPINLQSQNGFPTKLGEYLATGNPVVITRVGEISDFIKHHDTGLLAYPDNADSFAEQLSWAADHEQEAKEIGHRGKQLAFTAFNYQTQTSVALKVIDDHYKSFVDNSLLGGVKRYRGNFKGLFFISCYRIAHLFTRNKGLYIIGSPIWLLYRFVFRWILCIDVPERARIGKGCVINHGIGLIINPSVVIGDNVKLHQNTTIGSAKSGGKSPIIGNEVIIGAHCVILGEIKVGNGVIIGAGSVVTKDIPDNVVVAGNPAKILKFIG
jgi:serine acetyltransferase/glycosyltransferase involved in cell wall biosynthesis